MPKRGENIYKRKDGRWEGRYKKSTGYGYVYGRTYAAVKELLEQHKRNLQEQKVQSAKKSLEFVCENWLVSNKLTMKQSSYVKYQTAIENHILPYFKCVSLDSLNSAMVEEFTVKLLMRDKLSVSTAKGILRLLKAILKFAKEHCALNFEIPKIIYPKDTPREMYVLEKSEQLRLEKTLANGMDLCKLGVLLSLYTGLRIGELCALKWEDISLAERTIYVRKTMQRLKNIDAKNQSKTKILIDAPKSRKSMRTIPLPDFLTERLKRFECGDKAAYFLTSERTFIEPRTLQYKFKKYLEQSGINKPINFHALRHTFATRCVEQGFEIKSLSEILGHSSVEITLKKYVHASFELKRENMERLTCAAVL